MQLNFERLETRVALSHGIVDHIHSRLTIMIDDDAVQIPANIGLGQRHYNPHTHSITRDPDAGHTADESIDSGGIIHIGEGGPAGLSDEFRYVTLEDFFDVWREGEGTVETNTDALFASDQILGKQVDRHHSLTMYVNGVEKTEFEKYIPHDQDDLLVVYARESWAWQNYDEPLDTTGDGLVTPRDALTVINHINTQGAGPIDAASEPDWYFDVSGDEFVSAVDALRIIRHLNQQTT